MEESLDFSGINFGGGTLSNFDPDAIMASDVILVTLVVDISASVSSYQSELNKCINDYIEEMKKSHHAPKILVQSITFGKDVKVEHGYKPIDQIQSVNYRASDGATALYDGVYLALQNSYKYQSELQNDNGLDCKNIVFVITDGDDNHSKSNPSKCKDIFDQIMKEEVNFNSFSSILVGVGASNQKSFEKAQKDMGILHLKVISDSAKDIRSVIGLLSASTSSAASGGGISF